ncbi:hypothetical protein [Paenibacillus sp. 22594]|uniref:hypothetical protein n=1 Tax=Paenibacillus sp. 22594 TaxID=3453947 RepID=UPI003F846100
MSDTDEIIKILLNSKERIQNKRIYMVVNIKEKTKLTLDYNKYSITTEFFSDSELNELVSAFREADIYVEVIFGEDEFIGKILNDSSIDKNVLVYNTAQNGTGAGRKSLIPAFCNLHHIPITGSNAYVVSLCRNKYHVNKLLEAHNIPVAKSWLYDAKRGGWLMNKSPEDNLMVIAKPIYESASIGINDSSRFVYSSTALIFLKNLSEEMNQPIIVQEFISGYEVETPVICHGGRYLSISPVGISWNNSRLLDSKFLTYENIYFDQYEFYNFEHEDEAIAKELITTSKISANIVGIDGLGRIDYRITENGKYYVTDISTNPHLTMHSSYFHMFQNNNLTQSDILKLLITCALK